MSASLAQKLGSYLAERDPDSVLRDFQFLTQGWECAVYAFTLESPHHLPQSLILRVFPGKGADDKIRCEANGLRFLREKAYPVPSLLFSETDPAILGDPFCIMERIDGVPLWGKLYQFAPEQTESSLQRFGALMARLHGLDWRAFPELAGPVQADPNSVLDELFARFRAFCAEYKIPGFLTLADWLEEHRAEIAFQPAVVHLDFHANNVLLTDDGDLVVIDWTQASVSDYRLDLSWTLMLMGDHGQAEWRTLILEAYEQTRGKAVPNLAYFDVITYTRRLLDVVISMRFSPREMGLRADAIDEICGQTPVLNRLAQRLREITGCTVPEMDAALQQLNALSARSEEIRGAESISGG